MKNTFRSTLAIGSIFVVAMALIFFPDEPILQPEESQVVTNLVKETGAINTVSAVYLSTRLYDTMFEFLIFTIAAGGVAFYSRFLGKAQQMACLSDKAVIVSLRLLSFLAFLSGVYLAFFGHLSPGGGFAAGVAGGTALFLLALIDGISAIENQIMPQKSHLLERGLVITFLLLTIFDLWGFTLSQGLPGTFWSAGYIPLYNLLIFGKVTLGSWSIVYHFIQSRGIF